MTFGELVDNLHGYEEGGLGIRSFSIFNNAFFANSVEDLVM